MKELCEAGAKLNARCANKAKTPIDIARDKKKYNVIPVLQVRMANRRAAPRRVAGSSELV